MDERQCRVMILRTDNRRTPAPMVTEDAFPALSDAENKTASRWAKGYTRDPPVTLRRGLARSLSRSAVLSRRPVLPGPLHVRLPCAIMEAADGLPVRASHREGSWP